MLREGHADVLPVLDEKRAHCTRKGTESLEDFRLPA
jgi:hypothetical protein